MEFLKETEIKSPLWRWFAERADSNHALSWLALVAFLEPILLPLWPESLLTALVIAHGKQWKKFALVTSVASVFGGIIGYSIGLVLFHYFGASILAYLGLHHAFHVVRTALAGNIFLVMLLTTITPMPDKLFVLLGGFFHVPFLPFVLGFLVGRSCRFFLVAYFVHRFGAHLVTAVHRYFEIFVLVLLIAFLFALIHMLRSGVF